MDKDVDVVIVVAADEENQISRLRKRDGLLREEALRRIRSQMSLQEKIKAADYIIFNNGSVAFLQEQVDQVWENLTGDWERRGSG